MLSTKSAIVLLAAVMAATTTTEGFAPMLPNTVISSSSLQMASELGVSDAQLSASIQLNYKAGSAETEFARRYGYLAGKKIKTVGEAFAEFTKILGYAINPLYKGMITDIVGTTHLVVVNARFTRDPIWSLGMVKSLELLLKNYPEPEMRARIESSLFEAVGLNEAEIRADAARAQSWAVGKSRAEIESALAGEGTSELATVAKTIQGEQFWMYNRFFGIGLIQFMESVGIASDKEEVYPIMEDWMTKKLQKSHLTACGDSDLYFRIREKLDMMETMMKEIEIREKKRMAERLEDKADAALRAAEREALLAAEIAAEAKQQRDRVASS